VAGVHDWCAAAVLLRLGHGYSTSGAVGRTTIVEVWTIKVIQQQQHST
jgi:hypothetical protein